MTTKDNAHLPAGPELDCLVAVILEPMPISPPSLKEIDDDDLYDGPGVYSPKGAWEAHKTVNDRTYWAAREFSTRTDFSWKLMDWMADHVTSAAVFSEYVLGEKKWHCTLWSDGVGILVDVRNDTAALAVCHAAIVYDTSYRPGRL